VQQEMSKQDFLEMFGFLLAQEIAKAAPKDTGTMARSFPATSKIVEGKIIYTVPFYTKYVEFGTVRQRANPFIRDTIVRKAPLLIKQSIDLLNK